MQWSTGRWMPSAWPSPTMIGRSDFVRRAVEQPWTFFAVNIASILPMWLVAIIFGVLCIGAVFLSRKMENDLTIIFARCAAIATVPLSFVAGHSLLGAAGAGSQMRFVLPASPFCSLLFAIFTVLIQDKISKAQGDLLRAILECCSVILRLILVFSILTGWYYGVLYPTIYADLTAGSALDVIFNILRSPLLTKHTELLSNPHQRESINELWGHFGYVRPQQ